MINDAKFPEASMANFLLMQVKRGCRREHEYTVKYIPGNALAEGHLKLRFLPHSYQFAAAAKTFQQAYEISNLSKESALSGAAKSECPAWRLFLKIFHF